MWNALLDSRGASADASDEEVAVEEVEAETLAVVSREIWYRVFAWRPGLIASLLEAVERPDGAALVDWATASGVNVVRHRDREGPWSMR